MSLADVQTIIANAASSAEDALDDAQTYAQAAQSAAATIVYPGASGSIVWTKPTVVDQVTSATDVGTLVKTEAVNAFNDLGPDYLNKFSNFLTSYFPNVAACLATNTDSWICNMITNGGNGLPDSVVSMIWQKAREQISKEIASKRDEAYSEYAARGFTVPAGTINYRLLQLDQESIDRAASVSRETAIKNIEIQIDNVKFAISKAIEIREAAQRLAIAYVGTYIKAYDSATERARAMAAARLQFYSAINGYYDAFARIEALDVQVKNLNIEHAIQDNKLFVDAAWKGTEIRTKAALVAADALGKAAAAALGAQNSLAYTGAVENS